MLPQGMPISDERERRESDKQKERDQGKERGTRKFLRRRGEREGGNEAPGCGQRGSRSPPQGPRSGIRPPYFNILSALWGMHSIVHTTVKDPIFEAKEVLEARKYSVFSDTRNIPFFRPRSKAFQIYLQIYKFIY